MFLSCGHAKHNRTNRTCQCVTMLFLNAFTILIHNKINSIRWNGVVTINNLINSKFECKCIHKRIKWVLFFLQTFKTYVFYSYGKLLWPCNVGEGGAVAHVHWTYILVNYISWIAVLQLLYKSFEESKERRRKKPYTTI